MKKYSLIVLWILFAGSVFAQSDNLKLWYNKPAEKWTDALPIGNGRLGAMIYGGVNSDHIQFNEETLWSGGPRIYQRAGAASYLPQIRKLLFEGKQAEAEKLAEKHFMGMKDHEATYPAAFTAWLDKVMADKSLALEDDSRWETMKIPTVNGWEVAGLTGVDGAVWFRNSFELPAAWKGKNLVINLGKIRDKDITYINGVKVGSMDSMNLGRKYTIAASILKEGKNEVAVQVINPYDKGGLVGPKADQKPYVVYPEGEDPKNAIVLNSEWKYKIEDASPPAAPVYEADYQPFGDLYLNFKEQGAATAYRRELDIKNAISTTSYTANGVHFTREYFASAPDKAIVIHIKADKPGQINLDALLQTFQKENHITKIDDHTLGMTLKVNNGVLHAAAYLYAKTVKGIVSISGKGIHIAAADEVTLYLTAGTSFRNYKNASGNISQSLIKPTLSLKSKTYAQVKAAHIADYQRYFNKFSVDFGAGSSLPTDERIKQYSAATDPGLLALYMQYARYLMISCSRPDSPLPANLQGIWNDQLTPPWGSKFTTNINLQMNYWPVDELNLADCGQPLYKMIGELSVAGKATAKIHYNAPGWVLHHNTDIWLGTAPINASNHGIWQSGGAWLCHNLYEHYLFTRDIAFLKNAYPEMKGAAEFFVSTLVKDPKTGYLISTPSNSPEHGGLVAGPAMDRQIIRDLFKNCIAASKTLRIDAEFRKILEEKYKQIAPNMIGKYGQLQEWMEDKDDTADTHRHVSHLWGVYPGTDITWDDSPAMMHAAEQSFKFRGDDATGWSLAWKINLMARFKHADHAMALVNKLLSVAENSNPNGKERSGVYHNLFDAHPPFQIDGNFGGAAGIAEMLVQSQQGYIELFPALPSALPNGEIKGTCARSGFVLNMKWQNGKLQRLEVISKAGSDCELKYAGQAVKFKTVKGKTYKFNGELKAIGT
ncbi:glycoside hydrolase N-terminal domain-containing protein [Mucilaginibacter sp. PPCGB 2223]|uniref:glycoside hydrolase family 95 protein n=1 Tax=Mucilaginibacter sp. PPCGB 2223 TaxID=1886027 RepID=UPI001111E080|nr:glycoside hydrolase N-terminal domain-containing protein [Mucilaginibacter sp. PPCGB 2223]